jgi:WXG100 protein secretion system (Wss), protein YukD
MAQTRVVIMDPSGGKKTTVEVPNNVPAQRLTQALVTRMGLPAVDQAGRPISYRIGRTGNGEDSELNPDQTLAEAGVRDNDVLRLYASMQAGGR